MGVLIVIGCKVLLDKTMVLTTGMHCIEPQCGLCRMLTCVAAQVVGVHLFPEILGHHVGR